MYCRKKHRRRWRFRVEAQRQALKPRGQTVSTPLVKEWLIRTPNGAMLMDLIGVKKGKCRSIRHRGKQRLTRER
jgi:hypothetical protein